MASESAIPAALAVALKDVYGCSLCEWSGALLQCLDAAEHGVLCPECFRAAHRLISKEDLQRCIAPQKAPCRCAQPFDAAPACNCPRT
ncbi:MAG: hypothetical protein ABI809_00280 [Caldimonas sp.]